jgi:hypothetical protein
MTGCVRRGSSDGACAEFSVSEIYTASDLGMFAIAYDMGMHIRILRNLILLQYR